MIIIISVNSKSNIFNKFFIFLFLKVGRLYQLKKTKKIISISKKTKENLIKLGIERKKCSIIYNGTSFKPIKVKKFEYKNYIFNVRRKNLRIMLESSSKLKRDFFNLKFIIRCKINQCQKKEVLNLIKKNNLKLNKDIIFIEEYLSEKNLQIFYSQALFSIFISKVESFGLPVIESQACGCPVITSCFKPMSEICPYKELLTNPDSSNEIYLNLINWF